MAATLRTPTIPMGVAPENSRESIHAKRPIKSGDWLEGLAHKAWELRGSTLDFYDPDTLALTILGSGEMFRMIKRSEKLGAMSLKTAVKRARKEAPDSYRKPMTLTPEGLDIFKFNTPSRIEHIAVIPIAPTPLLESEFAGITQGIDLTAGRWHQWRGLRTPFIRLATIANSEHIGQDFLDELSTHLPAEIQAAPGFVRQVKLDDLDATIA